MTIPTQTSRVPSTTSGCAGGWAPRALALSLLAATLAPAFGCRPKEEPAICPATVGNERADEADTRLLPYDVWLQMMIPSVRRQPLTMPESPRECGSLPIDVRWTDEATQRADRRLAASMETRRTPEEKDLTFAEGPDGYILVWARVDYFDDGTARGPVALARWIERGVEIRGIGTLWAPYAHARIRLEPFGDGEWVLVADGEICPKGQSKCEREIYLLPLIEQRFVQAELIEGDVRGPARISALEQREEKLADGWVRRSKVRRSIRYGGASLMMNEELSVRECDPRSDPEECVEHETVRDRRELRWKDRAFWTDPSSWSTMGGSR